MNKGKKLTLKQKIFTAEYVRTRNGTKAAKKAYGVSDKVAGVMAVENLGKPSIKAAVRTAAQKLGIDTDYVLGNLKEIAEHNKRIKIDSEEMIDAQASIKSTELLGKHLAIFAEKDMVNNTQINFYDNVGGKLDDNTTRLINVTPKTKIGIVTII